MYRKHRRADYTRCRKLDYIKSQNSQAVSKMCYIHLKYLQFQKLRDKRTRESQLSARDDSAGVGLDGEAQQPRGRCRAVGSRTHGGPNNQNLGIPNPGIPLSQTMGCQDFPYMRLRDQTKCERLLDPWYGAVPSWHGSWHGSLQRIKKTVGSMPA